MEDLEGYIAVFRAASDELIRETCLRAERQVSRRARWLMPGKLGWVSAVALLLIAILFVPGSISNQNEAVPLQVNVSA
ncbi:MAG TPA: hypothetical protein VJ323_10140, partial [Bryobacteraceae bacterium]|nr:hypothetical protein [Bryobacteraceae bacterium]